MTGARDGFMQRSSKQASPPRMPHFLGHQLNKPITTFSATARMTVL
jgi:hypothetical protein